MGGLEEFEYMFPAVGCILLSTHKLFGGIRDLLLSWVIGINSYFVK